MTQETHSRSSKVNKTATPTTATYRVPDDFKAWFSDYTSLTETIDVWMFCNLLSTVPWPTEYSPPSVSLHNNKEGEIEEVPLTERQNWLEGTAIPTRIRGARNTDELTAANYTLYSRRVETYKIDLLQ